MHNLTYRFLKKRNQHFRKFSHSTSIHCSLITWILIKVPFFAAPSPPRISLAREIRNQPSHFQFLCSEHFDFLIVSSPNWNPIFHNCLLILQSYLSCIKPHVAALRGNTKTVSKKTSRLRNSYLRIWIPLKGES